jgi:hypothetical protein
MPAIRGFVLTLAAAAAMFTFGPRVLGQTAPSDPAAQIQLAMEHFDAARYREAMDAYDLAARGSDADLALRARKGKIRAGLRIAEFELARVEAETLVTDMPKDAEAPTDFSTSPMPRTAKRSRWRRNPRAPTSGWHGR